MKRTASIAAAAAVGVGVAATDGAQLLLELLELLELR